MRRALGVIVVSLAGPLLAPAAARAGDLQISLGAAGETTSWEGDSAVYSSFQIGWRWRDLVSVDFLGRLGYGQVDDRVLTYLSVGAELWGRLGTTRPHVRLGLVHQHEEPIAGIDADPFGALFGVGDGIRHRAGGQISAALDVPIGRLWRHPLFISFGAQATSFPDDRGPDLYWGAGAGVRWNWAP
jgi:hypothetical protein